MAGKTRVVGIAGGSASGKTTLATSLLQNLQLKGRRVELISADSFYHRDKAVGVTFISPSSGEEHLNFNHPNALNVAALRKAIESRGAAAEALDVLIVEGLMVLHIAEIREVLDVRIFVELEPDVRALRRMLRDMQGGRGNADPQFIASYYVECARVGHEVYVEPSRIHADLIVRGDADSSRVIPLLTVSINGEREA